MRQTPRARRDGHRILQSQEWPIPVCVRYRGAGTALASGVALGRPQQEEKIGGCRRSQGSVNRRQWLRDRRFKPGGRQPACVVESAVRVEVWRNAIRILHVNRQIVMVVVVSRLRVQNGVFKLLPPVRLRQGTNHDQALPQNGKQHQNGSESAGHEVRF